MGIGEYSLSIFYFSFIPSHFQLSTLNSPLNKYFTFNFQLKKITIINKKRKCPESTDSMFN